MRFVRAKEPEIQPDNGRCGWWSDGEQCRYPGSMSLNTLGGGPWYCAEHFNQTDQNTGAHVVRQSQRDVHVVDYGLDARRKGLLAQAAADLRTDSARLMTREERREAAGGIGKPKADGRAWARRIVGRYDASEKVLPIALALACDALRIVRPLPANESDAASERQAIQDESAFA